MAGNKYIENQLSNQIDERIEQRLGIFQDKLVGGLNTEVFKQIDTLNEQEADILHQISNLTGRMKTHQEFIDAFLVRFSIGFLLVMMFGGAIGAGFTILLLQWGGYL